MSLEKLHLLIVDDDSAIVRIVENIVSQNLGDRFAVATFTQPHAALNWINQHRCDVLVSDIEMPGLGGLDLLRAALARNPSMQTILLTAHSSWDHVAGAIECGASDYLTKPVKQAELVGLLRQQCERLKRLPGRWAGFLQRRLAEFGRAFRLTSSARFVTAIRRTECRIAAWKRPSPIDSSAAYGNRFPAAVHKRYAPSN